MSGLKGMYYVHVVIIEPKVDTNIKYHFDDISDAYQKFNEQRFRFTNKDPLVCISLVRAEDIEDLAEWCNKD